MIIPVDEFPERSDVEPRQPGGQFFDQLSHLVDTNEADQVSPTPTQLFRARVWLKLPLVLHLKPRLHVTTKTQRKYIQVYW